MYFKKPGIFKIEKVQDGDLAHFWRNDQDEKLSEIKQPLELPSDIRLQPSIEEKSMLLGLCISEGGKAQQQQPEWFCM
jgi:hypothetical protein